MTGDFYLYLYKKFLTTGKIMFKVLFMGHSLLLYGYYYKRIRYIEQTTTMHLKIQAAEARVEAAQVNF